jgi:RHS repeat-associated protein
VYLDGGAEQLSYATATKKVSGLRFYATPDGTIVVRSSAGTISYEVTSQQHTAVDAINASTLAVTRRYFDPYGNPAGAVPSSWPDANSYLGKPQDPNTGLDLLGARQYDPVTGRFLSVDPVLETGSPQQMGGYAYAADNPATSSDPTGLLLGSGAAARLQQDVNVNPAAPRALPLNRPISSSPTHNAFLPGRIGSLQGQGAIDMRVNQQQVDINGIRVGINRPDLQYTLNGQRFYEEFETNSIGDAWLHMPRIMANDPTGSFVPWYVP